MDKFEQGRWSLYVVFDAFEAQGDQDGMAGVMGEKAAFEAHILKTFGGLPEEYAEICRQHNDGRLEVSVYEIDYLAKLMDWLTAHCIPQEIRLVRNHERVQ